MSIVEIRTKQDAEQVFKAGYKIVIIDHYGDWCSPCKMIAPQYEQLAAQYASKNIMFAKCNSDLRLFEVSGLPTFEFYVNGNKVEQVTGADIERVAKITETLANGKPQQQQPNNQQQPQQQPQQPPPNNHPHSTGQYKKSNRGRQGNYSSYSSI